jgi:hypothetical protein
LLLSLSFIGCELCKINKEKWTSVPKKERKREERKKEKG